MLNTPNSGLLNLAVFIFELNYCVKSLTIVIKKSMYQQYNAVVLKNVSTLNFLSLSDVSAMHCKTTKNLKKKYNLKVLYFITS